MKVQNNLNARLKRLIAEVDPYIRQQSPDHYDIMTHVMHTYAKNFIEVVTELLSDPVTDDQVAAIKELLQINGEVTLNGLIDIKNGKGEELIWVQDDLEDEDLLELYDDAA